MHRIHRLKQVVLTILLFALVGGGLTGCDFSKTEAQALVKAGTASSERLATYYDSLAQKNSDSSTILSYLVSPRMYEEDKKILDTENKAYASRADLARKLKGTYAALGNLIDYDATTEVKSATGDLLTAVLKQVPHPDDLDSDMFKTVVGKIAGKLVEIQQEKEFKKNLPEVLDVLSGVSELFERERTLYAATAERYEDETAKLARRTLGDRKNCGREQATGIGAFEKFIEPFGLKFYLTPVNDAALCQKNYDYFISNVDKVSHDRLAALGAEARGISASLFSLERNFRSFLNKKDLPPLPIADKDVTDLNKLVAVLKTAIDAREAWEKAHKKTPAEDSAATADPPTPPEIYVPQKDFVADYLASMLSPGVREKIKKDDTTSSGFRTMLLDDLNRAAETGNIYQGILSKDGLEMLEKLRTFVLVSDSAEGSTPAQLLAEKRRLREAIISEVLGKLSADRTSFSGNAATPPFRLNIRTDPAAAALVRFNRAILSFVFVNAIAPQATS